ncbi:MAG TPA: right-handed parallel beta-helix repeat-containing protein, partial [Burkholderiales bacterium]|nr:right-handed parallel beta-helix repeat-containing protein [Burkholderiales bacterium]
MNEKSICSRIGNAALLAGLCFSALSANAATVSVDCDAGGSINAALVNVKPGDTVLASGTCNEQVSFAQEMVRVTLDGQKKTTIQHPGKGAASPHTVFIQGKWITIKGITVVGGLDGIHLAGPASAELDGNIVNKAARAGIHIDKGSVARILNNTVQDSGAYGIDITGVSLAYIGVRIPRIPALSPNTIRNNGGAGINIERASTAWIVGNTISNNKGSGIIVHRNSQADVMGNTINANGGDAITASFNAGVNLRSEPRKDGPNQTAQENGGAGIR